MKKMLVCQTAAPLSAPYQLPKKKKLKTASTSTPRGKCRPPTGASTSSLHKQLFLQEISEKLSDVYNKLEQNSTICIEGFSKLHKEILICKEEIMLLKKSSQSKMRAPSKSSFPQLPLETTEELDKFETELENESMVENLVNYLSCFGSSQTRTGVHQIMKRVLCNEVAVQYSMHGKGGKKKFVDLKLCMCVRGKIQMVICHAIS